VSLNATGEIEVEKFIFSTSISPVALSDTMRDHHILRLAPMKRTYLKKCIIIKI